MPCSKKRLKICADSTYFRTWRRREPATHILLQAKIPRGINSLQCRPEAQPPTVNASTPFANLNVPEVVEATIESAQRSASR